MQREQNIKPLHQRGKALKGMTTVQDSINALYVEAERNATDGTLMFALLDCAPTDESASTFQSDHARGLFSANSDVISSHAEPLAIDSLHTDPLDTESLGTEPLSLQTVEDIGKEFDDRHDDSNHDEDQTCEHRLLVARLNALYALAEKEIAAAAPELEDGAPVTALPKQPPVPPQIELDTDLNNADIKDLVQQARDDRDAHIGVTDDPYVHDDGRAADKITAMKPTRPNQAVSNHPASDASRPADETDIKAAMVEIAAAVNQLDSHAPAQMNMLRYEIVEAIKTELRATMQADLTPMVRRAVAEVLAETVAKELASKKATNKATAKKATNKATAKKATKEVRGAKPAAKKPAKANRTKLSGTSEA